MQNSATKFLGKTVEVVIDRPIGSAHPKFQKTIYPCNYGFIPETKAPDGKEIDAYVLGISEPLKEFRGQCIAVIHRTNDREDNSLLCQNEYPLLMKKFVPRCTFRNTISNQKLYDSMFNDVGVSLREVSSLRQ